MGDVETAVKHYKIAIRYYLKLFFLPLYVSFTTQGWSHKNVENAWNQNQMHTHIPDTTVFILFLVIPCLHMLYWCAHFFFHLF